jgi:hypothetical protein
VLLAGCGGETATTSPARVGGGAATTAPAAAAATAAPAAPAGGDPAAPSSEADQAQQAAPPILSDPNRKIIKDATFIIEARNVQIALTQIGNAAAQAGGYVLETNSASNEGIAPTALIKIAVPVEQFEATLQHVREAAVNIISEQASGQDVSEEFVDVQSQVANLETTQARIREFMDKAKTIEESLKISAQLSEIEGQISELKGRSQYLEGRAAYSTITVQIQLPPPAPEPAAPAKLPVPPAFAWGNSWSAGRVADSALSVLAAIGKTLATIVIWLGIVGLPFAPVALIVGLVWRSQHRRAAAIHPSGPAPTAGASPDPSGTPQP